MLETGKVLEILREFLTGSGVVDLAIQFSILIIAELIFLYTIFHTRSGEYVIVSHARLWIAFLVISIIDFSYYRLVIQLWPILIQLWPGAEWWKLLIYGAGTIIIGHFLILFITSYFVLKLDSVGRGPFLNDLVVKEDFLGEKIKIAYNAVDSHLIRRVALTIFDWFLFIPGLILVNPFNVILQAIILSIWLLVFVPYLSLRSLGLI